MLSRLNCWQNVCPATPVVTSALAHLNLLLCGFLRDGGERLGSLDPEALL